MKAALAALILTAAFGLSARAQTPAPPATATCNDGTAYSGTSRQGACSHHGGVQAFTSPTAPGQVWVNTRSKVYHCPGDQQGSYKAETAAEAAGDRPDHGKACS
jgi:hypothetical protein